MSNHQVIYDLLGDHAEKQARIKMPCRRQMLEKLQIISYFTWQQKGPLRLDNSDELLFENIREA
ncbi:MAG TPA: hypothetical protein VF338_02325 [Leptolinea sp.]